MASNLSAHASARFIAKAEEIMERFDIQKGLKSFQQIKDMSLELEKDRPGLTGKKKFDNFPAFLIVEVDKTTQPPLDQVPDVAKLFAMVRNELAGNVSQLAVMFYREPFEKKCHDDLLWMTRDGLHVEFDLMIKQQIAIRTLKTWIQAVKTAIAQQKIA